MLTDTAIRKAKPGAKPAKLADSGGLYLLLRPDGARWWRWDYRRPVTGKRNTLSLGTYPETGLADARARHAEARKALAAGIDPGEQRKAEKAAGLERAGNSFEVVAREWLAKQTWVPGYRDKVDAWLVNDVFPYIGGKPVADLKGALTTAEGRHHAAITDPLALGGLLRAIEGYSGDPVTRAALKLSGLLFVRPSELRHAEWQEIDLDKAEWNIPAGKMKMRQPHLVPLCDQAVTILRELHPLTGRGQYVFPGARSPRRPMSNNAINAALRHMGYDTDTMTAHGFRATARTLLDEVLGYRPDYIEHQLAHAVRDPNGRAYNRTAHLAERRKMMQGWADYLDSLRIGGNVVPIKRKAG